MKRQAVPATRRDRALPEEALPPALCIAHIHLRSDVRRVTRIASFTIEDAVDCTICCEHAAAIAEAKWALNHVTS